MSILFDFFLKFSSMSHLISEYKISWANVKKTEWVVTGTVPSGPFRVFPGVFERDFTVQITF
jgi:hypothetical protein